MVDKAIAIVLSFILQLAMTAEGDIPTVIDEMKQEVVCRPVCDLLSKARCAPDRIVRAVSAVFGRISFLAAL